ncbi:hypothetical protein B0H17DRAFT_1150799 [Mycena rosella]|uniref:Uncharacterized protein n=1 Tax=Mycena rosella TaxID=1033263 RepID=A0AAD7BQI7_MYCRO|nr:hypothetical protein B0H17DRAFT_1150799 [Mycena rosella]
MSYESRHALSARHFERLSSILTEANAHYSAVATAARAAIITKLVHPPRARTRAQRLGLAVNTRAAAKCDPRSVSVVPLPVIDSAPSPPPAPPARRARPALRLVVPRARPDVPVPVNCGPASGSGGYTGSTPAVAPTVLREQNNHWRGPTSRFSLTPDDPLFTLAPRRAPLPPAAADPPVVPDVPFNDDDEDVFANWELGYPASGAADYVGSVSSVASYASSSSSSSESESSASNSSGPATPADSEMIAIGGPVPVLSGSGSSSGKRKTQSEDDVAEKRPKYGRKAWVRGRTLC